MASSILSGRISHNSRDAAEMRVAPPCVQATLGTDSGFKAFTFHSWAAKFKNGSDIQDQSHETVLQS
ncbi:hypothetical protein RRG08_054034 [Elysia crispata]|uniref:Uncharacterized protein n=1 Tax=Elysia crispata TaxID=231223 RepID=A0AAE1DCC5_9GAST|nr:hypothetical protein RRG08_054034 [Elysia crispata]